MFLLLMILVFASCETATAIFSTPNHIPFPSSSSSIHPYPSSYTSLLSDPSSNTMIHPYPSCFTEETTWSNQEANDFITGVQDPYSCQALCLSSDTCHHFTWFNDQAAPFDLGCFLYDDPTEEYPCNNCVSGPQSCTCSGHFSCQFTPDNFVGDVPHVETEIMCQGYCIETDQCTFYSWFETDPFPKLCLMFSRCEEKDLNCKSCHSGPADCENTAIITSASPPATSSAIPSSTYITPTTSPHSTTPVSPYLSCFDKDFTWSSHFISSIIPDVYSPITCQENCQENDNSCTDFTWYSSDASLLQDTCLLFLNPSTPISCDFCVSGPSSCICGANYACKINDNLVDVIAPINDEVLCQEECFKSPICTFYTYFDIHSHPFDQTCYLFSSCDKVDFSCSGCSSGPDDCRNISHISTSHPPTMPTTPSPFISTTTHQSDCPELAPQKYGEWFCPPAITPATCHLECYPGYVSTNSTVILCEGGVWTEEPLCVAAVALITGGNSFTSNENSVEVYAEGLHLKMPDLPDERSFSSLQLVNSVVLLCGGFHTRTSCLTFTASHEWESHSTMIKGRMQHASISMMGQLYLFGGTGGSGIPIEKTTEHLTPPSHQWIDGWPLIETSYETCAAKMEPEVVMLSGGRLNLRTVVSYNVTSGTAARLQDHINIYSFHGCAAVRDAETGFKAVIVAGGNGMREDTSEIYDIKMGEWSVTGNLTKWRDNVRMVVLGQNILALGGDYEKSVDKFNLTTRTWSPTEEMLEVRADHAVTGVPPSLVGF